MLKIIGIVAVVLVVAVIGVLAYSATKPDTFRIARSTTIKAPPEKVFPLINDFRSWGVWSPYEKLDPDLKRTYEGPASGKGAVYAWEGSKAGAGRMEILEAPEPSRVTIKLDFTKSFQAQNTAEFTMLPQGDMTNVTWSMVGPNVFIGKVMSTFINIDKMVGKDFEVGLANLKTAAEK